jgi:hypothetical protein
MQEKFSVALSGKDATKLLEGLSKDPQLRADDDPSIMPEEQFPSTSCFAAREDSRLIIGQYHHYIAVGEAAHNAPIGGAEGNAGSPEEQNG